MNEENVVAANLVAKLTCRLNERQRLDVTDGSTDFGDDHVWRRSFVSLKSHASLDFVGDVRNDLNGIA